METILYEKIKFIIDRETGADGHVFRSGKFEGIGWLFFHYVCSTYDGLYPRLSIKQQSSGVHLYVMTMENSGGSILDKYIPVFGKSAIGKGCLRIKKLTSEHEEALIEIISQLKAISDSEND